TEAVALLDFLGLGPPADEPPEMLRDDQLRLVFTCCHPALALETQVALALHTLCGLSTAEVGRALLVPAATMYLLFTEGYGRADGATAADEALRLARLLHGLMPDEPAVLGLLALLLLQNSRRPARFTPAGDPVPLA